MDVLVIDSSLTFRNTIGNFFSKMGYKIQLATTLGVALTVLQERAVHLILVAYELDDGFGKDFAKICRQQQIVPDDTPIFLTTTTNLSNELIRSALLNGVTEVLSKKNIKLIYDQLENFSMRQLIKNTTNGCNIVYIEDEMDVVDATLRTLQKIGAKTCHFTGTDGVFSYLTHNPVDLIISDVLVDGEDTVLSLVHRLRTHYSIISTIPVLILTGTDNLSRRIEFFHVGINDYLLKPIVDVELLVRVKNLIIQRQFLELLSQQPNKQYCSRLN